MSNIKKFNEFFFYNNEDDIKDISQLEYIADWIDQVWDTLENIEENELALIFKDIENKLSLQVAKIIDMRPSADKLHYYQGGKTVHTGGMDTGEFIKDFENIQSVVEDILSER